MPQNEIAKQWGDQGEALVFLHYFGGSAQSWNWVTEMLSDEYRCIAINLPGFGETKALNKPTIKGFSDFVQKELKLLGIETYSLIGHSMGGKIAMQIAADAPKDTVKRLILIAPSPPTTEPMPEKEKKRMLHHPDRQEAEKTVESGIKKKLSQERHQLAVETQLIIDQTTWKWWLEKGMDHSIAEYVAALELPITVLASEDDPVMTPDVINERVMTVLHSAELINTKQTGHLIPMEDPDWIAEQIRRTMKPGNGKQDGIK
ncbi:alpha/beta hydrolase [Pontibacter sp. FD36]|uniref:alpha/beta fold hydrolase n=1 Tax=Pontibacter sp. FD36 TaxID=2789860 RepID=UPI0018A8C19B|nr:alpha/beta hydrolase [Pontibacter sp. FD36]MBF8965502.1 alpha/beta hydrolase [Pontibacter sp. FD36]